MAGTCVQASGNRQQGAPELFGDEFELLHPWFRTASGVPDIIALHKPSNSLTIIELKVVRYMSAPEIHELAGAKKLAGVAIAPSFKAELLSSTWGDIGLIRYSDKPLALTVLRRSW